MGPPESACGPGVPFSRGSVGCRFGSHRGFPEETAGLGGTVGTISGFLGSPKLSVLVWPSSALILEGDSAAALCAHRVHCGLALG